MSGLAGLLLANALVAGLIAVGAWAASRHLSRQTLVHALWVVALVKLVTPPIVPLPMLPAWTLPSLGLADGPAIVVIEAGADHKPLAANRSVLPGPPPLSGEIPLTRSVPAPQLESTQGGALHRDRPAMPVGAPAEMGWPQATVLAWLALIAGALAVATLAGHRILRFRRLLRHAAPAPAPLRDRVSQLAARVGLRRAPEVRLLPARVPPMLWPSRSGPLLLMPEGLLPKLTSEERDTLLVHELAHVRRRDHWVRLLELAVTVVFWWYPVTWWVRRALRRAEERCCDEWVLRLMPTSAQAYAEGLLKSLDHVAGEPDPLPVGASGAGPVHDLETRLKEILMMTRPTPHLGAPARVALSVVAVLGLAVFPTRAQSPTPGAEDEVTPAAAPTPAVAPVPAPRPVVSPTPRIVSPVVSPAPMPESVPAPRPVLAQAPSQPDDGSLREIEEQHRSLAREQAELHQKELQLTQERMARQSQADQEHMRAEVERLRAAGDGDRARLVEEHAKTVAERAKVRQRELELEQRRVATQSGRDSELQLASEKLRALEQEGRHAEAHSVQEELVRLQHEYTREQFEVEKERFALQREAMEVDYRAQLAEMELARAMAERDHEAMEADVERATRRQAWERALQERELAAREAEQSLRAIELAFAQRDAAGEHAEAEALRAEAEEARQHVGSLHRGIQEEHLLRSTSDLELQMESQLEALRHIQEEGAANAAGVQKEIRRLEAGLEAMRAAAK